MVGGPQLTKPERKRKKESLREREEREGGLRDGEEKGKGKRRIPKTTWINIEFEKNRG